MWRYVLPLADIRFLLDELLEVQSAWAEIPRFADLGLDNALEILEQAEKFAAVILVPINARGDEEACRFESGAVTTPAGFAAAYHEYCQAGWPSLACDVEHGGQGLPQLLNVALYEMLNAANHAWTMYPGLAHGAYECLRVFASPRIKAVYLPKIVSGKWLSTMCLTEPQAGSDIGLLRTIAVPRDDGSHAISGSKIFISGGDHDLAENIVHMVLARLPDAPSGTRGISLFLVPKLILVGATLQRNGVRCDGIEKKMGIRGSATCTLTFEAATGWMIGEPNCGLASMFVMMNSARVYVGIQGLGHAEMAYQNALRYASDRIQMRAVRRAGMPAPGLTADPIALHPSIRKILATLRAFVEGQRALGYWAAHLLDLAEQHPDPHRRKETHDLASLLTPIVKGFFTENGFNLSSAALQVWGGYGYIHEYGIEQSVRDSRVAMIYEGTNEIQANDLLVRKVIVDGGRNFGRLLSLVKEESERCAAHPFCARFGRELAVVHAGLVHMTDALVAEAPDDPEQAYRVAGDFMRLAGLLLLGMMWAKAGRLAASRASEAFYAKKIETASFFFDYSMPEAHRCLSALERRRCPMPAADAPA